MPLKIAVDLLVGQEINRDGPAKVAANAQTTIDVAQAIQAGASDPVAAIAAIDAALAKSTTDPAKLAALQTLIAWAGTKAAALASLAEGSVLSALRTQMLHAAAEEAIAVAQQYLPKTPASTTKP